ncbi:COP9 signalosome complex subunit 6 [Eurytemora carolleeae]|uniref:COP9 signalosome complex subunit 6 n=1 Tax=Eurytemora carolleeae TaxID=1294199 RepID=UPI000C7660CF|nr:COP9 signalosome complex subunit 6 [Eurytemora carolleeae]|eukprot:XP_023320520.1 COP9 signalosome complex subunit 6-like [Eurytemora affinis]
MDVEMTDASDAFETDEEKIIADSGVAATVSVSLHPLVIMNISEHWTRTKAQEGKPKQVYGALIGKTVGRDIEVMNSFELDYSTVDGLVVIDREYYNQKEEQFKQVFSEMDFLGWYSTGAGEKPTSAEIAVHRQIMDINESPLFLQLSPGGGNCTELPLYLFESVIDIVEGQARILFVKLPYTLSTEEAERIGLDHVARIVAGNEISTSRTADQLTAQHSAINMLTGRVKLILEYMKAVERGDVPRNHEILRQVRALSHRLPVLESSRFQPDFFTQANDVALMTLLGSVMKSANNLNQFVNKFNLVYQRQSIGRRMRGLFF